MSSCMEIRPLYVLIWIYFPIIYPDTFKINNGLLNYSGAPFIRSHRDLVSPGYANNTDNESKKLFNHKFLIFVWNVSYVLIQIRQFLLILSVSSEIIWNFPWIIVFLLWQCARITVSTKYPPQNAMSPLYWTVISQQHK